MLAVGVFLLLTALVTGPLHVFGTKLPITPALSWGLLLGVALLAMGAWSARRSGAALRIPATASALAGVALFFSDWFDHGWSFFQGPFIRGEMLLFASIAYLCLATVLRSIGLITVGAVALLLTTFFSEAAGRPLLADDHAVFLFRLELLKEMFPRIPFYYPGWNGGLDARDFFATGALNVFLLWSPIISFFDLSKAYNAIVAGISCLLPALSTWLAARILGQTQRAACFSALFALAASSVWFRWTLSYGTLGFATSTALIPLCYALSQPVLDPSRRLSYPWIAAWLGVLTLTLLWSLSFIALLPLLGLGVIRLPQLARSRRHLLAGALLLAVNIPWMVTFVHVSKVASFISVDNSAKPVELRAGMPSTRKTQSSSLSFENISKTVREQAPGFNPFLILFGLSGLTMAGAFPRRQLGLAVLIACGVASVIGPLKPQLELHRFLVIALLLLTLPAGRALDFFLSLPQYGIRRVLQACMFGFILTGPFAAASCIANRTVEQYSFAQPIFFKMRDAISRYGGDGRVFFSGFVLHELGGSHLAPLSLMTQKPLIAMSHAHNVWSHTDAIPEEFLSREEAGVEEYLDLLNVSAVVAHEQKWKEYFILKPERYSRVWHAGRFTLFQRKAVTTYSFEGEIRDLRQSTSTITFVPLSTAGVLKFRYFPFLRSSNCALHPHVVSPSLTLIGYSECAVGTPTTIESVPAWKRILQ